MSPRAVFVSVSIVLVLSASAAAAQNAPPADRVPTFSLSITEPSELIEAVGTTRRVTRADIESHSARTLEDALRLLPGIYVRTGGDGTPRIDVRGFRSRHVLLLVDGVPSNSTADGQFDPARLSTTAIREIKVSYGSSSVLYGDNALAAVIEITTVDSRPDATVEASLGAPSQGGGGGRYARTAGRWSMAAAATAFATDGYRLPDSFTPTSIEDGGRRQNSDRERRDVRAALGYRVSPAFSLASEWAVNAGSYGVPPGTIDDRSDIFAQTPRFERVEDYRQWSGQFSATVAASPRVNLRAWVYRNTQREDRARYDDGTYSSMDDPLVSGTFQSRERTAVTGSSALARLDLGRAGWLRLALNQRREAFDSSGVIRDVAVTTGGSGGSGGGGGGGKGGGGSTTTTTRFDVRPIATDNHLDVSSAGAEWQAHPAARLGTVLGGALNLQQQPGQASRLEPTWLAGVVYDATAALHLHASATSKVRMPSIDQLYDASSGNPDLRAERAYAVDAGAEQQVGTAEAVTVSVFNTNAHDFIERDGTLPFENHEHYRFRGAELMLQTSRFPRLGLRGGYSFLDADDLGSGLPLQARPRHRGLVDAVWTPVARLAVRGSASHTGAQVYDSRGANTVQRQADGFTLVDLGVTAAFGRRSDVLFDVTNVFDRLYDQAYGLPREGRAAVLSLRVRMN